MEASRARTEARTASTGAAPGSRGKLLCGRVCSGAHRSPVLVLPSHLGSSRHARRAEFCGTGCLSRPPLLRPLGIWGRLTHCCLRPQAPPVAVPRLHAPADSPLRRPSDSAAFEAAVPVAALRGAPRPLSKLLARLLTSRGAAL